MGGLRQLIVWAIRGAVIILLFGLALKNGAMVDVYFFFGQHWELPVSLLVLGSFGVGAVLGLTAAFSRGLVRRIEERQH